ncbi:MAG: cupin domain-containing protein [Candidatus Methanosuratincola sp.]|jgi:quercetin dioxygenase-like cupin family protein
MGKGYFYVGDLAKELPDIPKQGIVSRTLYEDGEIKAVLFGFDEGQELTEHTSPMPAVIEVIRGQARLRLAGDVIEGSSGLWVRMSPHCPHAVYAVTPMVMLLILHKGVRVKPLTRDKA